jgi:hypothetical protein
MAAACVPLAQVFIAYFDNETEREFWNGEKQDNLGNYENVKKANPGDIIVTINKDTNEIVGIGRFGSWSPTEGVCRPNPLGNTIRRGEDILGVERYKGENRKYLNYELKLESPLRRMKIPLETIASILSVDRRPYNNIVKCMVNSYRRVFYGKSLKGLTGNSIEDSEINRDREVVNRFIQLINILILM